MQPRSFAQPLHPCCLYCSFYIRSRMIHDVAITGASMMVLERGQGADLNLDVSAGPHLQLALPWSAGCGCWGWPGRGMRLHVRACCLASGLGAAPVQGSLEGLRDGQALLPGKGAPPSEAWTTAPGLRCRPHAAQHHRNGPFANLFTDIDVGRGTRPFYSGGAEGRGANTGRATTFWNVRSSAPARPLQLPPCGRDYGAMVNFVGSFKGGKVRSGEEAGVHGMSDGAGCCWALLPSDRQHLIPTLWLPAQTPVAVP